MISTTYVDTWVVKRKNKIRPECRHETHQRRQEKKEIIQHIIDKKRNRHIGWGKNPLGFSVKCYGKAWMNFLANSVNIFWKDKGQKKKKKKPSNILPASGLLKCCSNPCPKQSSISINLKYMLPVKQKMFSQVLYP